ncbi:MAG: multicopper oxidase domain-containing protein [Nitrospirae bacterium]|nr:multicopper oxidase domain-containing protein [Nitrospirota bacterium]
MASADANDEGRLDPTTIPKYVTPLVIPPAMPPASADNNETRYQIAVKQFRQQVLPAGFPKTTVWGYGAANGPEPGLPGSTYNYPAFTVETRTNANVKVKWINGLVDAGGAYLPHLLPVDQTLMWANPQGPPDSRPEFIATPGPYRGPVPIVTHVHGSHVPSVSDGNPRSWYLPAANNIPRGYFTQGTYFNTVESAETGSSWFEYPNTQRAATLWYHDHAMGLTRLNVYAGLAGFWLIRDAYEDSLNLPGPAPRPGDAPGTKYYEIPLAIQDRIFRADGSLFYPDSRGFFGDYSGPYVPGTTVPPIWIPEFFGDTMLVNGNTWPFLQVEPRKYRLRLLNGCNARTLILRIVGAPAGILPPLNTATSFRQIGNDGGLIPNGPVTLDRLLMGPAERSDVIVDFSQFTPGTELYLINEGPDDPFGSLADVIPADLATTGQVMKFQVVASSGPDESALPAFGSLNPALEPFGPVAKTRDLMLNEIAYEPADAPAEVHLGTTEGGTFTFMDRVTETPNLGDTEIWRFINLTVDAHPMHLHLVTFEVIGRLPIDVEQFTAVEQAYLNSTRALPPPDPAEFATGPMVPSNSWEAGRKDTVITLPGFVTIVKAKFDMPGLYVWHCHIIEHEDNEMMRPFLVMENQCAVLDPATLNMHVPCFDMGGVYSLDFSYAGNNPLRFTLADINLSPGDGMSGGASQCASFNPVTGILHLPCAEYLGLRYSADFTAINGLFEISGFSQLP